MNVNYNYKYYRGIFILLLCSIACFHPFMSTSSLYNLLNSPHHLSLDQFQQLIIQFLIAISFIGTPLYNKVNYSKV